MHNCLATRQARAGLALVVNRAPRLSGRSRIRRALEVGAEPEPGRCLSSGQLAQQPAGPIPQLDHHVIASA